LAEPFPHRIYLNARDYAKDDRLEQTAQNHPGMRMLIDGGVDGAPMLLLLLIAP